MAALAALPGLASCADPTGPVVGDWRGHEPSIVSIYQSEIEVILDGPPSAQSGLYHYLYLDQGELFDGGDRHLDWTDRWQMRPVVIEGQRMEQVHLANLAGAHIGDFILTPRGVLVPQSNVTHPDLSASAYRVALLPVPRGTFGYGRP